MAEKVFQALSSGVRRKILAYLSATSMTAGEISQRFDITKPSLSKHLSILENAGLVTSEKRGQFVHYSIVQEHLANSIGGFMAEVCPVARPLRKESRKIAKERAAQPPESKPT